jgi:hypothetical protein
MDADFYKDTIAADIDQFDKNLVFVMPNDASQTTELFPGKEAETVVVQAGGVQEQLRETPRRDDIPMAPPKQTKTQAQAQRRTGGGKKRVTPGKKKTAAPPPTPTPAAPADPAAAKALKNTRVVVTEAQKNFSATNTIENPSAAANNNWLAGNINNFMPWLKANLATLDNRTLNKWLRVMPLSSMAEWGEKNVPGMMELYNLGTKKIGQLHIYQRRFNEITKQLVALANKDGQEVIAKLAYFARIDRVDVAELGDTLDASYKADKPLQWIEAELAKSLQKQDLIYKTAINKHLI